MYKINPFAYFYYHLYLLQLEEYDLGRFFKVIVQTKGIPASALRKKLVWTLKTILIASMVVAVLVGLACAFSPIFLLGLYISYIPIALVVVLFSKKVK